jgi:hypothetical protein
MGTAYFALLAFAARAALAGGAALAGRRAGNAALARNAGDWLMPGALLPADGLAVHAALIVA